MRFRKRVNVFPGFHLNFSSSGISSTFGGKGASINFSKRGTYLNVKVPGMGSVRQKIGGSSPHRKRATPGMPSPAVPQPMVVPATIGPQTEIRSAEANALTSANLEELKATFMKAYQDRIELRHELLHAELKIKSAVTLRVISCILLIGFFIPVLKARIQEWRDYVEDLKEQLRTCVVDVDIVFDEVLEKKYQQTVARYQTMLQSEVIWDITATVEQDRKATRSAAANLVSRTAVRCHLNHIPILQSRYPAFHFENKNGGDLYIYPGFVIMTNGASNFGLIDIRELDIHFSASRFIEDGKIPSDAKIIGTTWAKVNKDGSPDKRFSSNYEIPIVKYAAVELRSDSGLYESYSFSNYEKAEAFFEQLMDYKKAL